MSLLLADYRLIRWDHCYMLVKPTALLQGHCRMGSLRKADVWESTAVPELRLQAALAADTIIDRINQPK